MKSTRPAPKKTASKKGGGGILDFHRPWFRKIVKGIWILFLFALLALPTYILCVAYNVFWLFGGMPSLAAIENPENDLSSEIISADGVSLGRYFLYNRSQVSYEQLSPELVNTLLISEDHRFMDHSGLDFVAFTRVIRGVVTGNLQGGGSTLTQQLAKNLFTLNEELDGPVAKLGRGVKRGIQKTKEWIIAIHMERNFTKEELIAIYLNTCNFGNNAYGIKVASETYFAKQPSRLNVQEAAVLVGMLQAPSLFNPKDHPEAAVKKRNEVLTKLHAHKYIKSAAEFEELKAKPIEMKYSVQNQNQGLATYFRSAIKRELAKWCDEHGYSLWESGLKIYTTIDSRMQLLAEQAMAEHMTRLQREFIQQWKAKKRDPWVDEATGEESKTFLKRKLRNSEAYKQLVRHYGENSDSVNIMLNKKRRMTIFTWKGERDTLFSSMDSIRYYNRFLQCGVLSMDPSNGAVKAWVGGLNHKYFKYDHVRQAARQPGSVFKPLVYGTAIESGYVPCQKFTDLSPSIKLSDGRMYRPKNSDGSYGSGEQLTMRQALARSVNSVSAQIIQKVTPPSVVDFAHRLGVESPLDPVPALSLGTSDVTLAEMVAAYSTFVNLGFYNELYYITRIEDKNGNVLENFVPKVHQAMDEQSAYQMVFLLQGGVQESQGTSAGLSDELKRNNDIGGKTGTTQGASDGWYVGITHNLVTGVWVGGDERSIRFPSWSFGSGSKSARPIWDKYMTRIYKHPETGYRKGYFKQPSSLTVSLDCAKYDNADTEVGSDTTEFKVDIPD